MTLQRTVTVRVCSLLTHSSKGWLAEPGGAARRGHCARQAAADTPGPVLSSSSVSGYEHGLLPAMLELSAWIKELTRSLAALSLDAVDISGVAAALAALLPACALTYQTLTGEPGGDISLAKNGELHKLRLNRHGERLTVAEYITPRHYGFILHKPRAVSSEFQSAADLATNVARTLI